MLIGEWNEGEYVGVMIDGKLVGKVQKRNKLLKDVEQIMAHTPKLNCGGIQDNEYITSSIVYPHHTGNVKLAFKGFIKDAQGKEMENGQMKVSNDR